MMQRDRCASCDKDIFWSFTRAVRIALKIKKKKNVDIRAYRCPRNRGWHVSSHQGWFEKGA